MGGENSPRPVGFVLTSPTYTDVHREEKTQRDIDPLQVIIVPIFQSI